jgi:hypothetical protein
VELLDGLAEVLGLLLHAVIASATIPMAAMPCTVFFTTPPVSFQLGLPLSSPRRLCA